MRSEFVLDLLRGPPLRSRDCPAISAAPPAMPNAAAPRAKPVFSLIVSRPLLLGENALSMLSRGENGRFVLCRGEGLNACRSTPEVCTRSRRFDVSCSLWGESGERATSRRLPYESL